MSKARDIKKELVEYLRELYLPAIGRCFEEKARQAERETMGYEQYLLELVERGIHLRVLDAVFVQERVEPGGEQIEQFDVALFDLVAGVGDVVGISESPIGASPWFAGSLPVLENGGLPAVDAAGLVDILFFRVIEIGQL